MKQKNGIIFLSVNNSIRVFLIPMLKNEIKRMTFDQFLFDSFFDGKNSNSPGLFEADFVLRKKKSTVKNEKINKTALSDKKENNLEGVLNKFFPGDYNSNIDIDDKMVLKWFETFNSIKDDVSAQNQKNISRGELKKFQRLSLRLSDDINFSGTSTVLNREISWTVQLAAISLAVFAVSSIVFGTNPGLSKRALDNIGNLAATGTESVKKISLFKKGNNFSEIKYIPKIEVTKADLAAFIVSNHNDIKTDFSGKSLVTKVNSAEIGGKVAGVVEVREDLLDEKKNNIHSLINEGERLIFDLIKNVLGN